MIRACQPQSTYNIMLNQVTNHPRQKVHSKVYKVKMCGDFLNLNECDVIAQGSKLRKILSHFRV
jgi:hypothetical protein